MIFKYELQFVAFTSESLLGGRYFVFVISLSVLTSIFQVNLG